MKKILVAAFILFGLFQLADVNYRMNHEGVGLLETAKPTPLEIERTSPVAAPQNVATTRSSIAASAPVATNPCATAGFALNATFTSGIEARLPELLLSSLSPERKTLAYFSELIGVKTPNVEFRWLNAGRELYREQQEVKSSRWRNWSVIKDLTNLPVAINQAVPLSVEIWSGDCMLHRNEILFSQTEQTIPVHQAKAYLDYHNTVLADAAGAFHNVKAVSESHPVYRFDEQRSSPKIYIDMLQETRSEATQDVFTQYVLRDKSLPLPVAKGGLVVNYSDANINRKTTNGDTPLLEAIKNNSQNTVKSLLAIGANPFIRDANNRSPLDLAVAQKNTELVAALLSHMIQGASVEHPGWSLLSVDEVLGSGNYAHLRERNRLGETALMRSAASGDEFAIIGLIGLADPNKTSTNLPYQDPYEFDYSGRQALDLAQESGYGGASLLLEQAMDQFAPAWSVFRMQMAADVQGDTPLSCNIQPGQRLWVLASLLDIPLKQVKLEWSVRPSHNHAWRPVKTQEYLVTNTDFKLNSYVDAAELGGEAIWEVQVSLYVNGRLAPNGVLTQHYSAKQDADCSDQNHHQKNSLKKQFAAWVPANLINKRATGFVAEDLRVHQKLLDDALAFESPALMTYLFVQGMDPMIRYRNHFLLRSAVADKKLALVQHLLAAGADLSQVDSAFRREKKSLINDAIYEQDLAMVNFLSQQGLPVIETVGNVPQPLLKAAQNCHADMIALLIKLGANPQHLNQQDRLAVQQAADQCAHEPAVAASLAAY